MKNGIVIVGYDLNYDYCQISLSGNLDEEPETLYLMDEKEGTELPLMLAKRSDGSGWVTGVEAMRLDALSEGIVVKDLLRLSLEKTRIRVGTEEINAVNLLTEFIRLSLQRLLIPDYSEQLTCIVFTIPRVDEDAITLLKGIAGHLGIPKDLVYVQDYKESMYDYISHQPRNLWNYEVTLFGFSGTGLYAYQLHKDPLPKGRRKELVRVLEGETAEIPRTPEGDNRFLSYVQNFFGKQLISSVYLIGRDFEEGWYPNTLNYMCKNRRVFAGRNLYSKGACYGGFRKSGFYHPDAIYLDAYKIVSQISLRLRVRGKEQWVPLAYPGENWYEINRGVEILVDQATQLNVQVDTIGRSIAQTEGIPLEGLFEKQRRTVRLHIEVIFMSKSRCRLYIQDVDFGEIRKATGYELTHTLQLENVDL